MWIQPRGSNDNTAQTWHMWRLAFPPHCRRLFVIRKVSRAGSFCIFRVAFASHFSIDSFIHPPIHSFIHSLFHSFLHSSTHSFTQSSVLFGFAPSIPLWLRLCLFLCASWLDFYFIFISISMKATCGRTLGHLSNFQSHIWRCHAPVLFPAPHTHTVPIPQGRNVSKKAF